MNINELVKELSREEILLLSCTHTSIEPIFDITPHEYLEFMEKDLKKKDKRSIINALSNGKRALDCQIQMLLHTSCMQQYADNLKLNIPSKLALLNNAGIVAPRILNKINKVRNMMEHEFYCPIIEEVEDFADVIILFVYYTDKFLFDARDDCEIAEYEISDEEWYDVKFDRENQKVIAEVRGKRHEKLTLEMREDTKNDFVKFIKKYIEIIAKI